MTPPANRAGRRFTLVELLTVIVIIGILAGLLLGVMSHARTRARMTSCASQLRQIGLAIMLYADEHADHLPMASRLAPEPAYRLPSLRQCLEPHVGEPRLFHCPADNDLFPDVGTSYEWNTFVSGHKLDRAAIRLGKLTIIGPITGDGDPFHGGFGRNYLYVDGRVTQSAEILIHLNP